MNTALDDVLTLEEDDDAIPFAWVLPLLLPLLLTTHTILS